MSNSQNHHQSPADDELHSLIAAVCDDTATAEQFARLEEVLLSDPNALKYYLDYAGVHSRLGRWVRQVEAQSTPLSPATQGSRSYLYATRSAVTQFLHRPIGKSVLAASLAIAAVLLVMSLVGPHPDPGPEAPRSRQYAARIAAASDCRWKELDAEQAIGHRLREGESITLLSGTAKIEFDAGAIAVLQGPSELIVESSRSGRLNYGEMAADVPKSSHGFSITTPLADIRVLGTAFSVNADPKGIGKVRVMRGVVDVIPARNRGKPDGIQRLAAGSAANVGFSRDGKTPQITIDESVGAAVPVLPQLPREEGEVSFQDGVAGYRGTMATFIRSSVRASSPDVTYDQEDTSHLNFDSSPWLLTLEWDADEAGVAERSRSLIAFRELFGNRTNQIPRGATIVSAALELHTTGEIWAESEFPVGVHEVLTKWREDEVTWASFGNGGRPGVHFSSEPVAEFTPVEASSAYKVDVTESVRRWASGGENFGWLLMDLGGDGQGGGNRSHFASDDVFDQQIGPKLTVRYEVTERGQED